MRCWCSLRSLSFEINDKFVGIYSIDPLVVIMKTLTFNLKELMFTLMKPLVVNMSCVLCWWISSQGQWSPSVLDLPANFSEPKTSSSVKLVSVTTGPRVITLRVLSSFTPFLMSLEKKPNSAIASKVSQSPTPSVMIPTLVWKKSWYQRFVKNIPIKLWLPSPPCPPQSVWYRLLAFQRHLFSPSVGRKLWWGYVHW